MPNPTYDRLRDNRRVLLEYVPNEDLKSYPYAERYTMTLLTQGTIHIQLNGENLTLDAPVILCTNYADKFMLSGNTFFQAQSICFHPKFVNRALDFETLAADCFEELNEQHDRDMMSFFNHKYGCNGVFPLSSATYLKASQWIKLMGAESLTQSDWSWTCRIRRYLLQTIYLLDDIYMEQWHEQQEGKISPVDKALNYIHTNYASCIELSDVCNIAGINRTKLNQNFKNRTGTTVIKYLNQYRISIARQSLIHTDLKLEELAEALGYRYSSYFITQFTKIVGMTPSEFRKQNRIWRDPHGRTLMKNMELFRLLEIPDEVQEQLIAYGNSRNVEIPKGISDKIRKRSEWDEGIKELQELLGDDPDGMKILWELLNMVSSYSYGEYVRRNIPEDIFTATMKFCTRFLREHDRTFHTYKFVWAWWFPRQISLNEYRIGALEYEFVEGEDREIAVHIPSDADLRKASVAQSIKEFYEFRKKYYPEWETVKLTCDTWMLMPELKELLGEESNIIAFQNLFEIDTVDYDATWYMGWIFPGVEKVDEFLPEETSLQRNMKKYLLDGRKFGIAKGHLIG